MYMYIERAKDKKTTENKKVIKGKDKNRVQKGTKNASPVPSIVSQITYPPLVF